MNRVVRVDKAGFKLLLNFFLLYLRSLVKNERTSKEEWSVDERQTHDLVACHHHHHHHCAMRLSIREAIFMIALKYIHISIIKYI